MKRISVIMPTITGREESRERMAQAYRDRSDGYLIEVISPKDYPNWPASCNVGQKRAHGSIFAFGSDDLEPLAGWADAMVECLERGELPAPQVWNWHLKGLPADLAVDGPPGSIPAFTRVVALTRDMAKAIGPWPEIDYYADNWVSDKARTLGWETRVTAGYNFIHHWHQHGRLDAGNWKSRSLPRYNAERVKLGLPPVNG